MIWKKPFATEGTEITEENQKTPCEPLISLVAGWKPALQSTRFETVVDHKVKRRPTAGTATPLGPLRAAE
jgi:hypothetical protein